MLDWKLNLLMKSSKRIANNLACDQASGKYFSLALSGVLENADVEQAEAIKNWLHRAPPDGVPSARLLEEDLAVATRDEWLATPAKHRQTPKIDLPVVSLGADSDWIWHPELSAKPFSLDFLDGAIGYRMARAESDSSPLRKALPKARDTSNKVVWDLCGGWRVDALLMAHWNFTVLSLEKSPWVHLVSARALDRSQLVVHKELRLQLACQDAIEMLDSLPLTRPPLPSIIYIDPMYPKIKTAALNQSEMRFLHHLSSSEDIADVLLEKSLTVALDRVVIKRPIKAEDVAVPPAFTVEQGSTRYDIYLTKR